MDAAPTDESLRPALEALAERDRDIAEAYARCGLPPVRSSPQGLPWAGPPRRCEPRPMLPESMGHRASARA